MKKLMIGLVGALAMVASADAVESSNIVGYDQKDIVTAVGRDVFNMFSVPFGAMNGKGFSLNKNISIENGTAAADSVSADQIKIWNAVTSGYETYYLYEGDEAPTGWYNFVTETDFDEDYPNGLPEGTAFWYLAKNTSKLPIITFAGNVNTQQSIVFNLVKGKYNMLANPYPKAYSINKDMQLKNAKSAVDSVSADQIKIWDSATSGYETYYLYEGDEAPTGWYNFVTETDFDEDYSNGLDAGTPFWYLAQPGEGSIEVTFTK